MTVWLIQHFTQINMNPFRPKHSTTFRTKSPWIARDTSPVIPPPYCLDFSPPARFFSPEMAKCCSLFPQNIPAGCVVTDMVIFVHFIVVECTSRVSYASLTIFLGSLCQVSRNRGALWESPIFSSGVNIRHGLLRLAAVCFLFTLYVALVIGFFFVCV